jgi:hypothetical protein
MLECRDETKNLIVLDRIHASIIFLVGSLLYLPVSIWDLVCERRMQDQDDGTSSFTTAQQVLMDDDQAAADLLYMDDAFATFQREVQRHQWLYLLTLHMATFSYLLNGLLETKMAYDDYFREAQQLRQLHQQQQEFLLLPPSKDQPPPELPPLPPPPPPTPEQQQQLLLLLLEDQNQSGQHLLPPDQHPKMPKVARQFKHEIMNGLLFCLAATLEFLSSLLGQSKLILSLSAHCYVANALFTLRLRSEDEFVAGDPSLLIIHAADWLFLVGACLDATGTWLELSGYLKEPASLWLFSSVAWLTDALLYLAADIFKLEEEEEEEYGYKDMDNDIVANANNNNGIRATPNDRIGAITMDHGLNAEDNADMVDNGTLVAAAATVCNLPKNDTHHEEPSHPLVVVDKSDYSEPEITTPYVAADENLV